jgi:hypothetical protein
LDTLNLAATTIRGAPGGNTTVVLMPGVNINVQQQAVNRQFRNVGQVQMEGGDIETDDSITIPALDLDSGELNGAATLTVTSAGEWSGGTMADPGTTAIAAGATFTIDGSGPKTLSQRTLQNAGTLTWNGGDITGTTGTIVNTGTSVFADRSHSSAQ